jgi:DNA-binding CsgD family transcriptional regulator
VSPLCARDYEGMLDLAVAALHSHDPDAMWPRVAGELIRVMDGAVAFLKQEDWAEGRGRVRAWTNEGVGRPELDAAAREHVRTGLPFVEYSRGRGVFEAVSAGQILGGRAWRNSAAASFARERFGAADILGLPTADDGGVIRGFLVYATDPGSTERARAYARRVQPLLVGMDAHQRMLRHWRSSFTGDEPAGGGTADLRLTPRELTVLALLADSLTAAAIGRRLGISTRTVHKHVENLYRKLGTRDRVAAVLRARGLGLLGPPTGPQG